MIHLPDLTPADVGRWVVYRKPYCTLEEGRIKCWSRSVIWVVYKCDGEWDRYADFTSQATRPEDLEFKGVNLKKHSSFKWGGRIERV